MCKVHRKKDTPINRTRYDTFGVAYALYIHIHVDLQIHEVDQQINEILKVL